MNSDSDAKTSSKAPPAKVAKKADSCSSSSSSSNSDSDSDDEKPAATKASATPTSKAKDNSSATATVRNEEINLAHDKALEAIKGQAMYKNMTLMLPMTRGYVLEPIAGPIMVMFNESVGHTVGAPPSDSAGAMELPAGKLLFGLAKLARTAFSFYRLLELVGDDDKYLCATDFSYSNASAGTVTNMERQSGKAPRLTIESTSNDIPINFLVSVIETIKLNVKRGVKVFLLGGAASKTGTKAAFDKLQVKSSHSVVKLNPQKMVVGAGKK